MSLASIIWGFVGGIFGWAVTTFVAQPLAALLAARSEAAEVLAQFEHCDDFRSHDETRTLPPEDVIAARARAYENCGAKLSGFDLSYQPLARVLRWRFIRWYPRDAGSQLILLAQLKPGGLSIEDVRQNVFRALRLGHHFGNKDRI
jgi:hypothetical protein